jgi:hypothetical protein
MAKTFLITLFFALNRCYYLNSKFRVDGALMLSIFDLTTSISCLHQRKRQASSIRVIIVTPIPSRFLYLTWNSSIAEMDGDGDSEESDLGGECLLGSSAPLFGPPNDSAHFVTCMSM